MRFLRVWDTVDVMIDLFVDLPKLTTISLDGHNPVCGDDQSHLRRNINGHESYDNTLVLKGRLNEY